MLDESWNGEWGWLVSRQMDRNMDNEKMCEWWDGMWDSNRLGIVPKDRAWQGEGETRQRNRRYDNESRNRKTQMYRWKASNEQTMRGQWNNDKEWKANWLNKGSELMDRRYKKNDQVQKRAKSIITKKVGKENRNRVLWPAYISMQTKKDEAKRRSEKGKGKEVTEGRTIRVGRRSG